MEHRFTTSYILNANIFIMLFVGLVSLLGLAMQPKSVTKSTQILTVVATTSPTTFPTPFPTPSATPLPAKMSLPVKFLVQAPHANWDSLHEDACEEASLLNVIDYLDKKPVPNEDAGEADIQSMIAYETKIGDGPSITLSQLNDIAKALYHRSGNVVVNPTITDIKQAIATGHPVIVGAAGKQLPNPFFKNGGPNYHMLVIKGYDDVGTVDPARCRKIDTDSCSGTGVFITNDVGIRQGDGFLYTYQGLYNAIHDWNATNILDGQKAMLVF